MKKHTFLKVMSVLLIIAAVGGLISAITMLGALGAVGVLGSGSMLLLITLVLCLGSAISLLLGGIFGFKLCKGTGTSRRCMLWGGISIGIQVLLNLINGIWGSGFQIVNLLSGLLLPVLYLVAVRKTEAD